MSDIPVRIRSHGRWFVIDSRAVHGLAGTIQGERWNKLHDWRVQRKSVLHPYRAAEICIGAIPDKGVKFFSLLAISAPKIHDMSSSIVSPG